MPETIKQRYDAQDIFFNNYTQHTAIIAQESEAKGKAEGIVQGKLAVALSLLEANMEIDQIVKLTKLSIEEIQELQVKKDK